MATFNLIKNGIKNGYDLRYRFHSEPFEIYLEYYAQFQNGTSPHHNAGIGTSYQLSDYIALYLSGGSTVDREEANQFVSAGLAVRMH